MICTRKQFEDASPKDFELFIDQLTPESWQDRLNYIQLDGFIEGYMMRYSTVFEGDDAYSKEGYPLLATNLWDAVIEKYHDLNDI